MCGRVIQTSPPDQLGLKIVHALEDRDNRIKVAIPRNTPPRYNAAPSQELWVIRQNRDTGERARSPEVGLLPYWCKEKPSPPRSTLVRWRGEDLIRARSALLRVQLLVGGSGWARACGT
jgi:putative SOS response-associated peptidase YedK